MTVSFTILPGLPPYGPMALPFPQGGTQAFREGLVVQFDTGDGAPWTGNFQRGWDVLDKVLLPPGGGQVIVIAGGQFYLVDPVARKTLGQTMGINYAEVHPSHNAVLLGTLTHFEAWRADGLWWKSPRISWDGIRNVRVKDNQLTGEAYTPLGDTWHPFTLDLLTGKCADSIYEADMSRRPKE